MGLLSVYYHFCGGWYKVIGGVALYVSGCGFKSRRTQFAPTDVGLF